MASNPFVGEIISIRKKYNNTVFELEKSKESVKSLMTENKKLIENCDEYKRNNLKLQEEKKEISLHLEEALKKIEALTRENGDLKVNKEIDLPKEANEMTNKKNSPGRASLKKQNSILVAQLRQMELGIDQNAQFHSQNKNTQSSENIETEEKGYDIEKIIDHKKKGATYQFLVRWKGYGPDGDTWETKSNLQCTNCKLFNAYLKKNKI